MNSKTRLFKTSISLMLVFLLTIMFGGNAFAAVWTDKDDYAPGSVVTISGDNRDGAGFVPGETVKVEVIGPNGYIASFEAVAAETGAWSGTIRLNADDSAVGDYTYTATGLTSGVIQEGSFKDGVAGVVDGYVKDGDNNPISGATVTCTTTEGTYTATTDAAGHYVFSQPTGNRISFANTSATITLRAEKTGYISNSVTADVAQRVDKTAAVIILKLVANTAKITFDQTGVGSDFTGTVLTVNSVDYKESDLPVTLKFDVDDKVDFEYYSPLTVDDIKYVWNNTSGAITTKQSGTITVTKEMDGKSVTGNYDTYYKVTFNSYPEVKASVDYWIGGDPSVDTPTGTLTTPDFVWVPDGSEVAFDYEDEVISTGRKAVYADASVTSPFTVNSAQTVTGKYDIYYKVTFVSDPEVNASVDYWIDGDPSVDTPTGTLTTPGFVWVPDGSEVAFAYADEVISMDRKAVYADASVTSPFTVYSAQTVTGNYDIYYKVTFVSDPEVNASVDYWIDGDPSVVTPTGTLTTPGFVWVPDGSEVAFAYADEVISTDRKAVYADASVTSPFTVNSAQTVTGNYDIYYKVTFVSDPEVNASVDYWIDGDPSVDTPTGTLTTPDFVWVPDGSEVAFAFENSIITGDTKAVFVDASETSPFTVDGAAMTVEGNYDVYYKVTFKTCDVFPVNADVNWSYNLASGTVNTGDANPFIWVPAGEELTVTYEQFINDVNLYVLNFVDPESPVVVDEPLTVTGHYYRYEKLNTAKSPGYWGNKNGSATLDLTSSLGWQGMLDELNLVDDKGLPTNFTDPVKGFKNFQQFINLKSTAVNMSYKLSSHLAAMELSVFTGLVDSGSMVYAPELTGFGESYGLDSNSLISVADLMSMANKYLGNDPVTNSQDQFRSEMESIKNVLDKANNNKNLYSAIQDCGHL